ncbi:MAG TPA: MASE1 domain-containing protein, partial [Gemmatimonadaceae bacterium]|nr:MASE1 domain-containing protein [Gemmatimonadaceae bacterium]
MKRQLLQIAAVIGLASVYYVAARLGLALDAVSGFATLVWPPAGIALAALLIFGYGLWPGVLLGAAVANLWAGAPLSVALGIGAGNTLAAVLATFLLRRVAGFDRSLERLRDALALIGLAAVLTPIVSATIGVFSLYAGDIVAADRMSETWRAWWLGDLIGDLVVAPALLVWTSGERRLPPARRLLEIAALAASVVILSFLVFATPPALGFSTFGQAYLFFPPLIWAALRFEQRGAATTAFVISLIAVAATVSGRGPFVQSELYRSLFALQTFMGVVAATFLVLGASIAERRRAKEAVHRAHHHAAQANRAKSEFLAVMSHELRTPLNAISGYVELLGLEIDGSLSDKQRNALSRIQRNQEHLLSLIDDVLNFARIETGRLTLAIETVPVQQVLAALEPLIEPELRRKELT